MSSIQIVERSMTDSEFAHMKQGMNEHALEVGNPVETSEKFGFVAMDGESFVGCSSGLVYRQGTHGYAKWAYLAELFVEKLHRNRHVGVQLLSMLEERLRSLGIEYMYTWTAGYEAPGFYKKQGYQVFVEKEEWYHSGHARVGLHKPLANNSVGSVTAKNGLINFTEREMTDAESARMDQGFDKHAHENGNPSETSERIGFVAADGESFVGSSSGLVYHHEHGTNKWCNLTDLYIEPPYRKQNVGTELITNLEERLRSLGIEHIYTLVAGYEALDFYTEHGYEIFTEMEGWYHSGHAKVGLRKPLR